MIFPD